jgi:hypothetical protein
MSADVGLRIRKDEGNVAVEEINLSTSHVGRILLMMPLEGLSAEEAFRELQRVQESGIGDYGLPYEDTVFDGFLEHPDQDTPTETESTTPSDTM